MIRKQIGYIHLNQVLIHSYQVRVNLSLSINPLLCRQHAGLTDFEIAFDVAAGDFPPEAFAFGVSAVQLLHVRVLGRGLGHCDVVVAWEAGRVLMQRGGRTLI